MPMSRSDSPDSPAAAGPIDLAVLESQTGGDAALAREVLALFAARSRSELARLAAATDAGERRRAAHALLGSARAVGAGEVARLAERIQRGDDGPTAIAALAAAVEAAATFIGAPNGGAGAVP
jgi:HPt (histidine-containing phosphotransfer) domain-containing protein